ncbi:MULTISPECIES: ArsC/Spx/MgsR family protein [Streptomyces]|uniref:Arsenate reductase family protein n=2 Tax=Streptomyces TaxID=1883 RepID=A0A3R7I7B0_9ACTN|nr:MULTISPECIES: ArsC/Spx/MgsR family protein [Streptomyces]KNE84033.1 arsenate reductase [Streptomyces fradiae]OFA60647.1 arsenate reductase [Streptomyces fradiae]PQM24718.1 arsenate reductase [Streptomyces xinghaiensis]RKM98771.1 arsenate reductase family protein [Streptomyces xinghaiensis]RNC76328.1 arsenate reductase family protein [Streptomyces xinghaiensis]
MEIWVNPACSKCRSAVRLLDEAGAEYTVRRYLEDPPDTGELRAVLDRLGLEPWDITRTQEPQAEELGIGAWPKEPAERERWIGALAAHPRLIQRPIITADDGSAAVARDEATVRDTIARGR